MNNKWVLFTNSDGFYKKVCDGTYKKCIQQMKTVTDMHSLLGPMHQLNQIGLCPEEMFITFLKLKFGN